MQKLEEKQNQFEAQLSIVREKEEVLEAKEETISHLKDSIKTLADQSQAQQSQLENMIKEKQSEIENVTEKLVAFEK